MGKNNGGGNPYHNPKTGEFTSGPLGRGNKSPDGRDVLSKDNQYTATRQSDGSYSYWRNDRGDTVHNAPSIEAADAHIQRDPMLVNSAVAHGNEHKDDSKIREQVRRPTSTVHDFSRPYGTTTETRMNGGRPYQVEVRNKPEPLRYQGKSIREKEAQYQKDLQKMRDRQAARKK